MKKLFIKTAFSCFLLISILSCSNNDDSVECQTKQGDLHTSINEVIHFNPRLVYYGEVNNLISLAAVQLDDACLARAIVSFTLEKETDRQDLHKRISGSGFYSGTTTFSEWDGDAILGKWDLLESEPAWIEINVLEDNFIEGIFQSTYLHKTNQNNFHSLPDTLRFHNVSFKAEFIELPDDQ